MKEVDVPLRVSIKKNTRTRNILLSVAVAMFAFGYALVPMYNVLCKQFGINGKTSPVAYRLHPGDLQVDKARTITMEFLTSNNGNLPWSFYPKTNKLKFHPGEMEQVFFYARNNSDHDMTIQAIPSVTPGIAAKYLKKTECFCFTQQTLHAHEQMDMPVLFHLDTQLPSDVNTVTLSYTLFDVSKFKKKAA